MVHDNESEILTDDVIAALREDWNPSNWDNEEDPRMKYIMQRLAEHYYNLPEAEFREYVLEAYGTDG